MSKKQQQRDDLTQGSILGKLLRVAVPIMGTQLMQMSYNLTDMYWLGKLSSGAVAASGTGGMYMWLITAFWLIGRMGAEIGVSQSLGRHDEEASHHYCRNAMFLSIFLGLACALTLLLGRHPLVAFFRITDQAVAKDAALYLGIVALSVPFWFFSATVVGCFNASGNARTPFWTNAVGLVANMILDPLMIMGLDMGIAGAALATALSQVLSCLLIVYVFYKHKKRPFARFTLWKRPNPIVLKKILRWTVPIGMESMLFTLMAMLNTRFITAFGTNAMAASRVCSQIESLSWLVGGGFGSAVTAFVGQNYGAGQWGRIHRGVRISFGLMTGWGILIALLIYTQAGFLFSLFLKDPAILAIGVVSLHFSAFSLLPQSYEVVASNSFKGIGRTIPPSIASITSNALMVLLAYLFSRGPLGLTGIWLGGCVAVSLRGLWTAGWYLLASRKFPKEDLRSA